MTMKMTMSRCSFDCTGNYVYAKGICLSVRVRAAGWREAVVLCTIDCALFVIGCGRQLFLAATQADMHWYWMTFTLDRLFSLLDFILLHCQTSLSRLIYTCIGSMHVFLRESAGMRGALESVLEVNSTAVHKASQAFSCHHKLLGADYDQPTCIMT